MLRSWTPIRVRTSSTTPSIDWALLDGPPTEPFFEQSAQRAMTDPFNQVFGVRTPLDAFEEIDGDGPSPAGFVFHMSRCGSTLIARMLARLRSTVVLSEPQPIDALIRLHRREGGADGAVFARRLRGFVSAVLRAQGGERRAIVKFHAWHVLELPLIAAAYPDVPWIFVYREPREVLQSQSRAAGGEYVGGTIDPAYLGITDVAELGSSEYGPRFIGALCRAALRVRGIGKRRFVPYASLPDAVPAQLLDFFGIDATADEIDAMKRVATIDAKDGQVLLRERAEPVSAEIEAQAARWLDAAYTELRGE